MHPARLALAIAAVLLAPAALPSASNASVTCTYDPISGKVALTVTGMSIAWITRDPDLKIGYETQQPDPGNLIQPITPCGAATISNTTSITLSGDAGLDESNGYLAPQAIPVEPISITTDAFIILVYGSPWRDAITIGDHSIRLVAGHTADIQQTDTTHALSGYINTGRSPDTITQTSAPSVYGHWTVDGGSQGDTITMTDSSQIQGGDGADRIYPGCEDGTRVYGGNGADTIMIQPDCAGNVWIDGNGGNDTIYARDLAEDFIDGGRGFNVAQVDDLDSTKNISEFLP
jgi:Ca2+-binding RTX toxin-like protein